MSETKKPWANRIVGSDSLRASEFLANPANWRVHPGIQQDALDGILAEVGWVQQVVVNRRTDPAWGRDQNVETLIDGHLRVSLALSRDESSLVPVVYVDLDPEEERLVLATLDPIGAMATADTRKLDELLRDIQSSEPALQAMLAELAKKSGLDYGKTEMAEDPGPQLDRAAELQKKWSTCRGQLWTIPSVTVPGRCHRLLCGDSTDAKDVARSMGGERAVLVITDPPYGVEYASKNAFLNAIAPANRIQEPIAGDHETKKQTQAMWKAAFHEMAEVMAPGAVVYCFMPQGGDQMMMMMMMMMGAGIEPRHELIWLKNNHVLGRVDYAYKHEPILYAWKEGGHKFYGDFQTSVLEFPKPQASNLHPTTKPSELIARLVGNSSQSGERIYDPFLGSGTTMVAAEQTGRICHGCEIAPKYVGVCLQRMADMGLMPLMIESGANE